MACSVWFMALNDLMAEVAQQPGNLKRDEPSEIKVLNQVLALMEDQTSEVRNQAVKCLGQLIRIIRGENLNIVVNKLVELCGRPQEQLRDIAGLAVKTVVSGLPSDGEFAYMACIKLFPILLEQLQNSFMPPDTITETLSTIYDLVMRFPRQTAMAQLDPVSVIAPLLTHPGPLVRKSAVVTLVQCLPIVSKKAFASLLKRSIIPGLSLGTELNQQLTIAQLLCCIARYSPDTLDPVLKDVMSAVLNAAKRDDSKLKEGMLQTMETLVLRCPSEIRSYLPQILAIATELIKYDPNRAEDVDDSDEDMGDANDDEDAADDYCDDNDTSYKVRYSATKVIAAIVGTQPELLSSVYKSVSPVLISQFGDREETVRLELWSTYETLIKQTGLYGEVQQARAGEGTEGKPADGMEVAEDTPYGLLKIQAPQLSNALLKQLQPKPSPATLLAGFSLLRSLLVVLPGSLSTSADFSMHPPESFRSFLPRLTPQLLNAASRQHPSVATEALRAFSALLTALKPVYSCEWVDKLYVEVVARLKSNDTDLEVRQCTEGVVVDLWLCAFEIVKGKGGTEWDALMRGGGRTDGAVQVITRVAANADKGGDGDAWVTTCIDWVVGLLKKPGKIGKAKFFACLEVLLRRYHNAIPKSLPGELIPQLQMFLSLTDLDLLTHALVTLSVFLSMAPKETLPLLEESIMPTIYKISYSPLLSGASLKAMANFFFHLVTADREIFTRAVPGLVLAIEKSGDANASPANVSKCISAIVRGYPGIAGGVIADFAKGVKPGTNLQELRVVLSLMVLGEIGRTIDMQKQLEVFNNILTFFTGETELVRSTAAFAAGNVAAGNVHYFCPLLIAQMRNGFEKRLLSLHALKEIVSHCPREHIELVAGLLWEPLFEISDTKDETTRKVAAACFGQLATSNPSQYLPEFQHRLAHPSAFVRATVVSAVGDTFVNNTQLYDNLLSPLIEQLMVLVYDEDLIVRELSLSTLNTAAQNKPHLVREHLQTLMPLLYGETMLRPRHTWSEFGLEARGMAYQTLSTIMDKYID